MFTERHARPVMKVHRTAGAGHEAVFNPAATDLDPTKLLACQLTMRSGQRRPHFLTHGRSCAGTQFGFYIGTGSLYSRMGPVFLLGLKVLALAVTLLTVLYIIGSGN